MPGVVENLKLLVQADTDRAQKDMDAFGQSVKDNFAEITAAGIGASGALVLFADSQSEMNANLGRMSLITGASSGALRDMATDMSSLTFSTDDVVTAMDGLVRAGITSTDQIQALTPVMGDLAKAAGIDVAEAVDLAARSTSAFGKPLTDINDQFGTLAFLLGGTSVEMDDFADILSENAVNIQAMGLTIDDVAVAILGMNAAGVQGEETGEKFGSALEDAEGDVTKFWGALGTSAQKLEEQRARLDAGKTAAMGFADVQRENATLMSQLATWANNLMSEYGGLATVASALVIPLALLGPVMAGLAILKTAASVAALNLGVAFRVLWAAIRANPFGFIITIIGLVIGGLILLWNNSETFRNIVKGALKAVGDAAIWLWNNAIKPAWEGIKIAFKAVGDAAVWLWENAIKPVIDFIVAYFRVWAAIVTWLWSNVIQPVFQVIAAIFTWLWENIISPIVTLIGAIFQLWMAWMQLVGAVILFVIDLIVGAFVWLWDNGIKPVVDFIVASWEALGVAFQWVYDNAIKPVVDLIGQIIDWLWHNAVEPGVRGMKILWESLGAAWDAVVRNVIQPVIDFVKRVFTEMGRQIEWVYQNIIRPIIDAIGWAFDKLRDGFSRVGDVFRSITSGIASAFRWLWDQIRPIIDWITNAVGRVTSAVNKVTSGIKGALSFIPGLAEGGTVTHGGTVLVGEQGPEFLTLPRGASVTPLNQAPNMAMGGGGVAITLDVTGADYDLRRLFSKMVRVQAGGSVVNTFGG